MMKKILIAEDDAGVAEMLEMRFKESGYEVVTAATGPQALEKIAAEAPDLVILDYSLPRMSGAEVCRKIKSNPKSSALPVLMLSGHSPDCLNEIQEADAVFEKPYRSDELLKKVRDLLGKRGVS